jgi:hypothetical protein
VELDEVIARALAKSPADRFARAEDFAAALAAVPPRPPPGAASRRGGPRSPDDGAARRSAAVRRVVVGYVAGRRRRRAAPELVSRRPVAYVAPRPGAAALEVRPPAARVSPRLDGAARAARAPSSPRRAARDSPGCHGPRVPPRRSGGARGRLRRLRRVLLDGRRTVRVDAACSTSRAAPRARGAVSQRPAELAPDRALKSVKRLAAHSPPQPASRVGARRRHPARRVRCATSSWPRFRCTCARAIYQPTRGTRGERRLPGRDRARLRLRPGVPADRARALLAATDGDSAVLRYKLLRARRTRACLRATACSSRATRWRRRSNPAVPRCAHAGVRVLVRTCTACSPRSRGRPPLRRHPECGTRSGRRAPLRARRAPRRRDPRRVRRQRHPPDSSSRCRTCTRSSSRSQRAAARDARATSRRLPRDRADGRQRRGRPPRRALLLARHAAASARDGASRSSTDSIGVNAGASARNRLDAGTTLARSPSA